LVVKDISEVKVRLVVIEACGFFSVKFFIQSFENDIILLDHLGLLVHVLNLFLMSQLCFLSDFDIKLSRLLKLLIVVDRSGLERDFQLGIDGFKG
jgi:hypothetical protein